MVEFSEVEFSDDEEEDGADGLEPAEGVCLAFFALSQAFEPRGRLAERARREVEISKTNTGTR